MSLSPVTITTDPCPARSPASGQGADHIVRFHTADSQQRQPPASTAFSSGFYLRSRRLIRHGRPVRLVLGKDLVAEGFAGRVENHGQVRGTSGRAAACSACSARRAPRRWARPRRYSVPAGHERRDRDTGAVYQDQLRRLTHGRASSSSVALISLGAAAFIAAASAASGTASASGGR